MNSIRKEGSIKIDLHAHYLPQAYRKALLNYSEGNPDGFPTPEWSPERHLETMNLLGITTSMLSLSSPHVNFGDRSATKALARIANEDGAELVRKYPGKFGLLASLPLPNVEDSIAEIQYAADILQVDGFTLPTNTLGVYLGNPCLNAIFKELHRRKSVVTLHPNKPRLVPERVAEGLPAPMMEYFFDTTRTVVNLIVTGTLNRFSDIKFIIPHAGAFLPVLADRIAPALQLMPSAFGGSIGPDLPDIYAALRGLYYDLAGACLPRQLDNIMQIVEVYHFMYGSDFPYTPDFACKALAEGLDQTEMLTEEQRRLIYSDNALRLFPRLRLQ